MYAVIAGSEENELGFECRVRVPARKVNARDMTSREKHQGRVRHNRRSSPKLRTPSGVHQRRNHRYAP
jgi:hypothetical protein